MSLFESSLNHLRRQLDALTHDFTSALGANASRLTGFNPFPGQQQLQQHTPRTWATPRSSSQAQQKGNRAMQGSFFDPFFDDPFFRDSNDFLFNSRNRRGRRLQQPQQPQQLQQSTQQASPSAESTNQSTSSSTPQESSTSTSLQSRPQSQVSEWGDTSPSPSSQFGWLSPWSNMIDSPMEFELPEIKVDVHEEKDKYVIKAETPGIPKENVKVKVEDGYLTITGEKKEEKTEEDKDKKYRRMERSFGTMQRSFSLPQDVDVEKIEAKYDNGVLSLTLPRSEQKQERGKEISIQ